MYDKPGQPRKIFVINGIVITTYHPLYNLRYGMMARCYRARPKEFKHYQGKGIIVCDEWKNNQESFFEWCLNNGWKKGLVIDRIDSNRNYEPGNCQFITSLENNKRQSIARGIRHRMCTTSIEQVQKIKELLSLKRFTEPEIAKQCGVTRYVVSDISRGKTWRNI